MMDNISDNESISMSETDTSVSTKQSSLVRCYQIEVSNRKKAEKEREELRKQIDAEKAKQKDMEGLVEKMKAKIESLTDNILTLRQEKNQTITQLQNRQIEIEDLKSIQKELRKQLETKIGEEVAQQEDEVKKQTEIADEVQRYEELVAQKDAELVALNNQVAALTETVEKGEQRIQEEQKKVELADQEIVKIREAMKECEERTSGEIQAMQSQVEMAKKDMEVLRDSMNQTKEELEKTKEELEQSRARSKKFESDLGRCS